MSDEAATQPAKEAPAHPELGSLLRDAAELFNEVVEMHVQSTKSESEHTLAFRDRAKLFYHRVESAFPSNAG